jgi:hypothetical protein
MVPFYKKRYPLLILFLLLKSTLLFAGIEENPNPLIDSIKKRMNLVKDYTADIKIKVDVAFIKVPVKEGLLYYKSPDKVKLVNKGFAMLPKKGMGLGVQEIFLKPYTAIWIKREKLSNTMTEVIRIVPSDDQGDIVLATFWIDRKKQLILKVDAVTRSSGSNTILFSYPAKPNPFDLPSRLTFKFEVTKNTLPMGVTGDFDTPVNKKNDGKPQKASLTVDYANFKVNTGLSDQLFKSE